jgi:hypothetical protein
MESFVSLKKFKKHCNQMIKEIQKSKQTLFIIHERSLVAKVISIDPNSRKSILGLLRDKAKLSKHL